MISRWSFSAVKEFEECPHRTYLRRVKGIEEPVRPAPPPPLTEWHNDRGSRVHEEAELYVNGLYRRLRRAS